MEEITARTLGYQAFTFPKKPRVMKYSLKT
jgi:hypothetical protein